MFVILHNFYYSTKDLKLFTQGIECRQQRCET